MIARYFPEPPEFPEPDLVAAAEPMTEAELLGLMRKHCQKSWQATRWMLEMQYPEKYGKRKPSPASSPSSAEFLSAIVGVVADEIADDALRARIEARLDALSVQTRASVAAPVTKSKANKTLQPAAEPEPSRELEPGEPPAPSEQPKTTNADNAELPVAKALEPREAAPSLVEPASPKAEHATTPAKLGGHVQVIKQVPDSQPVSWMAMAREQNEERKRQRKLRDSERQQNRKQRGHAGHGKKRHR